jgi:hypothetical protein
MAATSSGCSQVHFAMSAAVKALAPTSFLKLRQIGEGAGSTPDVLDHSKQLLANRRHETVPYPRRVNEALPLVISNQKGVEVLGARRIATDHEFLSAAGPHFDPCTAPLAGFVQAVAAFRDDAFETLRPHSREHFVGGDVKGFRVIDAGIRGAGKIFVVDQHPDRLKLAKELGAIPIDQSKGDAPDQVLALTEGLGADCGCEAVGYQCHDHHGHEVPNMTMNNLVKSVKATGGIGVIGVFVPKDPGAKDSLAKKGEIAFDLGNFWFKGQKMATGQANVKAYNRKLRDLIAAGKAKPSAIISHELGLDEAPDAYKNFDNRKNGWTKVVLKPAAHGHKKAASASKH